MLDQVSSRSRKLLLIELNEVNFDVVSSYVASERSRFPAFDRLLSGRWVRTTAEKRYEELEPWIQWPSVHNGLSYQDHDIFRLGDVVGTKVPQMFEQLEQRGLSVGCISAMNAENRLRAPAYFIPDPWTRTPPDRTWWSSALTDAISQAVGDNSQGHISAKSAVQIGLGLMRFAQPKHYGLYWRLASASRGASWRKALLLDLLLHDVHSRLFGARQPDFSTLFLNAGAHIQHHYFFNARPIREQTHLRNPAWYVSPHTDPVGEMLDVYDRIIGEYLDMPDVEVLVATGLSQRPYDRVKFYYRLRDHATFLRSLGVPFKAVAPRMTRDFLIEFETRQQADAGARQLARVKVSGTDEPLFGDIDNRGTSLFVTLTYPSEINASVTFELDGYKRPLAPHVVFVAIKNGMHQEDGFAFFTPGIAPFAPKDRDHVKELYATVMHFFGAS
jgi:hypothetical protein